MEKTPVHKDRFNKALMNSLSDAVYVLDGQECVVEFNPAARLVLNLPDRDILQQKFTDLFPEFYPLSEANGKDKPQRVVLIRTGWPRFYDVNIIPLKGYGGASQDKFVIFHDVTGQQMAEEELRRWARYNTNLDNLGRVPGGINSSQTALRSLTVQLSAAFDADGAAIILWNDDIHEILTVVAHGVLGKWDKQSADEAVSLLSCALDQEKAYIIEDIANVELVNREIADRYPARSSISFPIRTGDTPIGIVVVAFSIPHKFTKHEISRFELVMEQIRYCLVQACLLGKLETTISKNTIVLERANQGLLHEITERTLSEDNLRAEHSFITGILDTLDALVIVIDRKGCIVRVNQVCEQFFGISQDEFSRKRVWDLLLQSQDNVTITDMFANIQAGLSPFQYANRWQTKDGVQKMVAWSSSMLYDVTGNIQYIVAIGMDITEKKHIEKLLERERLLFRGLIDSIPDLIFYKDRNGIYLGWNAAFGTFRQPKPLKKDLTDADLYPQEEARHFMETDFQVIESGKAITYENWTINAAGQQLLIETQKTPYHDSDGEIIGVIGIGRDITRHRNAENALRTANMEIEQLISSLSSCLIVVSRDLYVTRWNVRAQSLFGITAVEAIGKHLTGLGVSWEWEPVASGLTKCEQEYNPIYLDPLHFKRIDGSEGYFGMNISPIFGREYTLTGYILLGADITERITMERRLSQAQKLESIGQLAAGIAHEINTPMQYIGDNASFLQISFTKLGALLEKYDEILTAAENGHVSPELVQQVKIFIRDIELDYLTSEIPLAISQTLEGIQHVVEIVRAMKGFSHPGVKKMTPVNINKALLDTLTVARNEWKYVATAETDFTPDLPDVMCLPGEMNQVFLNIIVNAADSIADIVGDGTKGKGKISIQTRLEKDWVEVRISDTGTGIPEENRNRIFEPFYTTKEVGKGTGQGLAIAYDIVEVKHGGTLTFDTRKGEGTTFIIRIPLKSAVETQNHQG
jgi:PAS domain S-box-containing protein